MIATHFCFILSVTVWPADNRNDSNTCLLCIQVLNCSAVLVQYSKYRYVCKDD